MKTLVVVLVLLGGLTACSSAPADEGHSGRASRDSDKQALVVRAAQRVAGVETSQVLVAGPN